MNRISFGFFTLFFLATFHSACAPPSLSPSEVLAQVPAKKPARKPVDEIVLDEDESLGDADEEAGFAGSPLQAGEIELEAEPEILDNYTVTQDGIIAAYRDLDSKIGALAGGNLSPVNAFSKEPLNFLAATYLYCTNKNGTCPMILEGVFEIDLINAAIAKNNECPNMRTFWAIWLKSEMNKRKNFKVTLGKMDEVNRFEKTVYPKFVKCKDKVKEELAKMTSADQFFRKRYKDGSHERNIALRVAEYISELKKKNVNVFSATGTR